MMSSWRWPIVWSYLPRGGRLSEARFTPGPLLRLRPRNPESRQGHRLSPNVLGGLLKPHEISFLCGRLVQRSGDQIDADRRNDAAALIANWNGHAANRRIQLAIDPGVSPPLRQLQFLSQAFGIDDGPWRH